MSQQEQQQREQQQAQQICIESIMCLGLRYDIPVDETLLLNASFKKTYQIKPFESETMELSTEARIPRVYTLLEQNIVLAVLQAQLQFTVFLTLYNKGFVSSDDFYKCKVACESSVTELNRFYNKAYGKTIYDLLHYYGS